MLALAPRALCLCALATVTVIACAPVPPGAIYATHYSASTPPLTATSRVIDAERIERSGSITALDAIRSLVPGYRLEADPVGTGWPGTTATSRGPLRVLVDGHPVGDVESLTMIRATEVLAIHILRGPDAVMRFGPGFAGGAIVIQTRLMMQPRAQ